MGTTYHYTNLTKREWFSTGTLGGSAKYNGLGRNLAARVFELLLVHSSTPRRPNSSVLLGRWGGDAIAIIGDEDDKWPQYNEDFIDLAADVILFCISTDGFDRIGEVADDDDILFMQLCHLISTRQAPNLEPKMRERYGTRFWQRYKNLCLQCSWYKPMDIALHGSI